MKIAFIITGLSAGGAEIMLLKLLQHIDRSRFYPYVISLSTKGEIGSHIEALNIPVYALEIRKHAKIFLQFLKLVKHLHTLKPDIVHTWMYHADLLGGLATRLAGVNTLAWSLRQSNLSPTVNKRATLMVMKLCAMTSSWLPHSIHSCSEHARNTHITAGYFPEKIKVIPNGFNLTSFSPDLQARISVRSELGLPLTTPIVGMMARYDPQKNHIGFIEAAIEVITNTPNTHFILAGKGVDCNNTYLMQSIHNSGLNHCIHLLGKRDDIPRLMASLDVLASPSWGEGFSNVLGEVMASAVPCVVTNVGDSADIVGDTGYVVAPGDMQKLAYYIIKLLQDPEHRLSLGQQARRRIQQKYEITNVTQCYERFYLQMIRQS